MQTVYTRRDLQLPKDFSLCLFSVSKFRRQILDNLHIHYFASRAGINEKQIRDPDPKELTMKLAQAKMDAVLKRSHHAHSIIVTADQVAWKNGKICEKPTTEEQCHAYLNSYCNSYVELYSAICVFNSDTEKRYTCCDVSRVEVVSYSPANKKFADIPMSVQDYLIEKGDVFYSCGGITVEDPKLQQCITHIDEMDRVMGLPLQCIQHGIDLTSFSVFFDKTKYNKTKYNKTNKQKQHKKTTINQMMNLSSRKILTRSLSPPIFYTTLNTPPSPSPLSNPSAV